uniref:Uncharacterized protein n=1 Tax=Setaria digitata TaxID=48799 RepID=A0A915Q753_9BILA
MNDIVAVFEPTFLTQHNWEHGLGINVIRPQSVVFREVLRKDTSILPVNESIRDFSGQVNSKNNAIEIRTGLQAGLVLLSGTPQIVDIRFTAPPLRPLEPIISVLSTSQEKGPKGNIKKDQKKSILLRRGSKKFRNNKTADRDEESSVKEFWPKLWTENFQIKTSKHDKEISPQQSNTGYQNYDVERTAVVRQEVKEEKSPRHQPTPKKHIKSPGFIREVQRDSDDLNLLMNRDREMLTPKPSVYSEHRDLSSRNKCNIGTAMNNQPWVSLNVTPQPEQLWTNGYQISKVSNWNIRPMDQFVTPITPINHVYSNFVGVNPSTLSTAWMPSQVIHIMNGIQTSRSKHLGYSSPSSTSIVQGSPLPTVATFAPIGQSKKSNYQTIGAETSDYGGQQRQKESTVTSEYQTNSGLKSATTNAVEHRQILKPASEFLIPS